MLQGMGSVYLITSYIYKILVWSLAMIHLLNISILFALETNIGLEAFDIIYQFNFFTFQYVNLRFLFAASDSTDLFTMAATG